MNRDWKLAKRMARLYTAISLPDYTIGGHEIFLSVAAEAEEAPLTNQITWRPPLSQQARVGAEAEKELCALSQHLSQQKICI